MRGVDVGRLEVRRTDRHSKHDHVIYSRVGGAFMTVGGAFITVGGAFMTVGGAFMTV